jgi:hypothetical protein
VQNCSLKILATSGPSVVCLYPLIVEFCGNHWTQLFLSGADSSLKQRARCIWSCISVPILLSFILRGNQFCRNPARENRGSEFSNRSRTYPIASPHGGNIVLEQLLSYFVTYVYLFHHPLFSKFHQHHALIKNKCTLNNIVSKAFVCNMHFSNHLVPSLNHD